MKKKGVRISILTSIVFLAVAAGVFFYMDSQKIDKWDSVRTIAYCRNQTNPFRIQGIMKRMLEKGRTGLMFDIADECNGTGDADLYVYLIEEIYKDDAEEAIQAACVRKRIYSAVRIAQTDIRDRKTMDACGFLYQYAPNAEEIMSVLSGMDAKQIAAELVRMDMAAGRDAYLEAMRSAFQDQAPEIEQMAIDPSSVSGA